MKLTVTKLLFLFSMILVICQGCEKNADLTACFTVEFQIVAAGQEVQFTNCSIDGTTFQWSFDDGNYTNVINPTHIFEEAGVYDVSCTVTNEKGAIDTYAQQLTVLKPLKMVVNKITITQWPEFNKGLAWDTDGSTPDLYPKITDASYYLYVSPEVAQNCIQGNSYSFEANTGLLAEVTHLDANVFIEWYDADGTSGDYFMGSLGFVPNEVFAESLTEVVVSNAEWEFFLEVSWQY
jgi:PKD repeat protein